MTQVLSALPLYCERAGDGPWAEPLNVLSSGAFFLAAGVGWMLWRRAGRADRPIGWLALAVALIGCGSLSWHVWRQPWAFAADVVTAQVFIFAYMALALRRFFRLGWPLTGAWLAVLAAATLLARQVIPSTALAGGATDIPALLALYLMGAVLVLRARVALHADMPLTGHAAAASDARHFPALRAGYALILAGILFALALAARTLDLPFCAQIPVGLHALWHILWAMAAAVLLAAAIRHGPVPAR
ncbi:MAG TPA: hypothetical protein PK812_07840 [Beijerinckiaceae bacterium]|nr:hypothetical protein [Beijerinckiaceae bacterium]